MPEKVRIAWNVYHKYDELTRILHELAGAYSGLASLYSIGRTYQGRDIWCLEITNKSTGPALHKPGFQIDGNTHSGEVTGCAVALYDAYYLLSRYGEDDFVTGLVDTRVIYVIPRVSADGAEHYLTTPHSSRSSLRPYPLTEEEWLETDGLYPHDINGDGWALQMRLEDPQGEWKASAKDPRLMVKRQPKDGQGPFYHIYPEGLIRNYRGGGIKMAPPLYNLDFNRNWPSNWAVTQDGAGPYPLCEPENRALADFWRDHPNLTGVMTYHTFSGVIIRTFVTKPDDAFNAHDLKVYKEIGRIGTEVTGYESVSVFEGLTDDKKNPRHGNSKDWWYEDLGAYVFCIELWSLANHAGIEVKDYMGFLIGRSEEDDLKLLAYNDSELGGQGFMPWTPFDHPQLGRVEIGGWKTKYTFQNPPHHLLKEEIDRTFMFCLKHAALSPLVRVTGAAATAVGGGVHKVTATVRNEGWLPTNLTKHAQRIGVARPDTVRIDIPEGAEILSGRQITEIGNLEGKWNVQGGMFGARPADSSRTLEWLIKAPAASGAAAAPGEVKVQVRSHKGGRHTATVKLDGRQGEAR
ncbi:MAG: M14 family metallopeptidase [Bacillota bacterium]|nr:M14 family metallopeptidase [Bacillota bacterium]